MVKFKAVHGIERSYWKCAQYKITEDFKGSFLDKFIFSLI